MFSSLIRNRNPIKLWITRADHSNLTTTPLLLRFLHKTLEDSNHNPSSFTVSYLINSCGLSHQSALSAATKISIKTTHKPDSMLSVFKSYGFTEAQIAKLVAKFPVVLSSNPEKTIKPKLDYFLAVGFCVSELADLVCSYPILLKTSLQNRLKPNFELLSSIIGDIHKISVALRRTTWLLCNNLETNFLPNVRTLQSYGVPPHNIARLAALYPRVVMQATEQFAATVNSIKKLGFDPDLGLFVQGVSVMSGMNPSTWERKVALYKSLGWSDGEVISAFTKGPFCMLLAEEKIRQRMDFFVNKLHWEPSRVASRPQLLFLSLEKRVIPRWLVMNVLESKGLVRRNLSTKSLLISEKDFLKQYVIKYQDQIPEVCRAYKGNLEFVGLEGESMTK